MTLLANVNELKPGDQVKVRLQLNRSQYVDWQEYKNGIIKLCGELKLELCGLELVRAPEKIKLRNRPKPGQTQQQVFDNYCTQHKFNGLIHDMGQALLK